MQTTIVIHTAVVEVTISGKQMMTHVSEPMMSHWTLA